MGKGSQGILSDIEFEASKNLNSQKDKNLEIEESRSKRSYNLKNSTIKKIQELALYNYPVGFHLEDIVDEAINYFYTEKIKDGK